MGCAVLVWDRVSSGDCFPPGLCVFVAQVLSSFNLLSCAASLRDLYYTFLLPFSNGDGALWGISSVQVLGLLTLETKEAPSQ